MLQDLRFSLRMFGRNPAFTVVAIFTLALGIGATTLIFGLADSLLFHAFPYRDAARIVLPNIHELRPGGFSGPAEFSDATFPDYIRGSHALDDIIGYRNAGFSYRNAQGVQQVTAALVTPNTFQFLGIDPLYGRPATAPGSCVVSYRFWLDQLAASPNAVGSSLTLDQKAVVIAGIMPPRFAFLGVSLWIPHVTGYVQAMGRLKPGVSLKTAATEFDAIERGLAEAHPDQYPDKRFRVSLQTLPESAVGNFRTVLYSLFAAVTLLLLIACVNVANLLLSRAASREHEMAIRAAVGATRARLVRQLIVESATLAAAAGVCGCALAQAAIAALTRVIPAKALPGEAVIAIQSGALWFACGITLLVALLSGLAPALHSARIKGSGRPRSALVVAEVALSFVLLTGAGLMTRTFIALTHADLGFDSSHLLHARMTLPRGSYRTAAEQRAFLRNVVAHVQSLRGVTAATFSLEDTAITGGPDVEFDEGTATLGACDETYFQTMRRPVLSGGLFTAADIDGARRIAIVNQAFVRSYFPNRNPLGRQIRFHVDKRWRDAPEDPNFLITGVVADARNNGLRNAVRPQIYVPYSAFSVPPVGIMVRTRVAPLSQVQAIRRQVWAVDPNVALTRVGTVEDSISDAYYAEPRFGLLAIGSFASIGLLLVAVGVFGVMAYSVSTRRREIGIRMALGAQPSQVLGTILRQGMALMGAGTAIGLPASLFLARLIASQLWGVAPNDPATFLAVVCTVMIAGVAACLIPARRAARVDPAAALNR